MKKHSLLLLAGGMLAFAACNSGTQGNGASQATIDSMVNVRVMELQTQMQAKNDSIINALATAKADSIVAAMKGEHTTSRTHTSSSNTERKAETKTNTVDRGGLKAHSDQNRANDKNSVEGGGLKSHSDQNRANQSNSVDKGGLKSHSDQNRK